MAGGSAVLLSFVQVFSKRQALKGFRFYKSFKSTALLETRTKFIMAGQMKISSFFSQPLSTKSSNTIEKKGEDSDESVVKKAKIVEPEPEHADPDTPFSSPQSLLSEEEKGKVERNKLNAKLKLLGTKTCRQIVNVGPTWFDALEQEFGKEYLVELSKFVAGERKKGSVYPPVDQVFTWTTACPIQSVKVVIIGQDPYHGPRQAHGLCFSVLPGIKPPPSLENMFKELSATIDGFKHPKHGNLTGWATQGVLLLNACLTVRAGAANSHAGKGWEKLTDAVIHWLNSNRSGLVFLLWGAYAQKKGQFINKKKHHVLTVVHPSPLSAHRGFFGCNHFSRCNDLLKADGKTPIDWTHLPQEI